eukprot:771494-Prymnesium_polylepis.2
MEDEQLKDKALLDQMPHWSLRRQVLFDIHMRTMRRVPLFFGSEAAVLQQLCNAVTRIIVMPETTLCKQGDVMTEMYFLEAGCLANYYEDDELDDELDEESKSSRRSDLSEEMGEDQKVLAKALSQCALSREMSKKSCEQESEADGNGAQRAVKVDSDSASDVSKNVQLEVQLGVQLGVAEKSARSMPDSKPV